MLRRFVCCLGFLFLCFLLFGWVCFGFLGWLCSDFPGKIRITSEGCFVFSVTVTWQTRWAVSGGVVVYDAVSHDSPGDYRFLRLVFILLTRGEWLCSYG